MPAERELYAAALPPLAAALSASSPYLQTGPVGITSLLTFGYAHHTRSFLKATWLLG